MNRLCLFALILLALCGCADKSEGVNFEVVEFRDSPRVFLLADKGGTMPSVTLYKNGNARLSQPSISSFMLTGIGEYSEESGEVTVTHGGFTMTFAVSDGGNTLTVTSTDLHFSRVGAVYELSHEKGKKVEGEKMTVEVLRGIADGVKSGKRLEFSDFDGFAYIDGGDPDIRVFDVGGEYTVWLRRTDDGYNCDIERNDSGENFPLGVNGSTGYLFDEFLGLTDVPKYTPKTCDIIPNLDNIAVLDAFWADLTNDGKPEFCATVDIGSGHTGVMAYDEVTGKTYELRDPGVFDYRLSIPDAEDEFFPGKLVLSKYKVSESVFPDYAVGSGLATMELLLLGGEISEP